MECIRAIFFFQAEEGIRDSSVTGVQTCALPICAQGKTSQEQSDNRGASTNSCQPIHSHHGQQGEAKCQRSSRSKSQERDMRHEHNSDGCAQSSSTLSADDIRVSHRVAKQSLEQHAGNGKSTANQCRSQNTQKSNLNNDGLLCLQGFCMAVEEHRRHRSRFHAYCANASREEYFNDQQYAEPNHDYQE